MERLESISGIVTINHYETITTVVGQGEIHLAGVPFNPGTEVEIVVSPKPVATTGDDRLETLLVALDRARNIKPIGSLKREELYDRNHLH